MDNRRLILTLIFCFSLFMLWEGWMKHNQPPAPPPVATAGQDSGAGSAAPTTTLATPGEVPGALGASATAGASAPTVTVRTDMVTAEVSALGGSIVRLELVQHKDSQDKTRGFVLLDNGTVPPVQRAERPDR